MRRRLFPIALAFVAIASAPAGSQPPTPAPAQPPKAPTPAPAPTAKRAITKLPAIETFQLVNGLKVAVLSTDAVPVAAVQLWYRAGSKDERRDRRGSAHTGTAAHALTA